MPTMADPEMSQLTTLTTTLPLFQGDASSQWGLINPMQLTHRRIATRSLVAIVEDSVIYNGSDVTRRRKIGFDTLMARDCWRRLKCQP